MTIERALSLTPYWAAVVAAGLKPVENRRWGTKFRGEFYIHASKGNAKRDPYDVIDFLQKGAGKNLPEAVRASAFAAMDVVKCGGIIARATLVDCVTEYDSPWFFGPYGFVLENVQAVPFVACAGALSFWKLPADVQAKIAEAA